MRNAIVRLVFGLLATWWASLGAAPVWAAGKTQNVVLIVCDGLRPEEVFTGAEAELLRWEAGGNWLSDNEMRRVYWDADPVKRRERIMPFLWNTVAAQGQIFGNAQEGSNAKVTNGYAISYPGYNEMITGAGDRQIDNNDYGRNPNINVFEWLERKPELSGKVAIFGTWFKFHDIFNDQRNHLLVRSGPTLVDYADSSPRGLLIQQMARDTTRLDRDDPYDSFVTISLNDYLDKHRPRVMFVGYGDTDSWAHMGRYDLVLETAHSFDTYVEALWKRMQSLPEYKDTTTFIITADHGRGHGPVEWKEHGAHQQGSENVWIAIMGPDTPPLGERHHVKAVTQSQIAATVAALLGEDFRAEAPKAAASLLNAMAER